MKKWIFDQEESNIINVDFIQIISFVDKGHEYTERYRIMAETDMYEYILFQTAVRGTAIEKFQDYYKMLNSSNILEPLSQTIYLEKRPR